MTLSSRQLTRTIPPLPSQLSWTESSVYIRCGRMLMNFPLSHYTCGQSCGPRVSERNRWSFNEPSPLTLSVMVHIWACIIHWWFLGREKWSGPDLWLGHNWTGCHWLRPVRPFLTRHLFCRSQPTLLQYYVVCTSLSYKLNICNVFWILQGILIII